MSEVVFIEQAPSEGREHRMEPGATIGREECDIILTDPDVSRRHAAIRLEGEAVAIEDLGSTNGTYVNGERIGAPRSLRDGDEVKIGSTVWRVSAPRAATRLAQVQSPTSLSPQVTRARPTGAPEPPTEPPAAAPEPEAPARPAAAAEPPAAAEPVPSAAPGPAGPAAGPAGRRGDVPAPDFQPSAIRRVVPGADAPTPFAPADQRRRRGSAATRLGATLLAGAVVALTAAGVVLYYITEPFK
jgi:predicted component of type VI protein secretion system